MLTLVGTHLHFRRIVPGALQPIFGKTEEIERSHDTLVKLFQTGPGLSHAPGAVPLLPSVGIPHTVSALSSGALSIMRNRTLHAAHNLPISRQICNSPAILC